MRILETDSDKREFTSFLKNHPRCNFQQSLEWAKIKTSWITEVILAEDVNKKIIGSLTVWVRKNTDFWKHNVCTKRSDL